MPRVAGRGQIPIAFWDFSTACTTEKFPPVFITSHSPAAVAAPARARGSRSWRLASGYPQHRNCGNHGLRPPEVRRLAQREARRGPQSPAGARSSRIGCSWGAPGRGRSIKQGTINPGVQKEQLVVILKIEHAHLSLRCAGMAVNSHHGLTRPGRDGAVVALLTGQILPKRPFASAARSGEIGR